MLESLILVAVICNPFGQAIQSCVAYELDYNLTQDDCDSYFTDSGVQVVDTLLALHVPEYKASDDIVLSCEIEGYWK
jgi:hypothetical protein